MKSIALIFTLMLMSGIAYAEPVYLKCSITLEKEKSNFSVKIDEGSGKITHTQEGGDAFNTEGFFAVNEITYQKIGLDGGIKITQQYKVDRTDLSVRYIVTLESVEFP